MSQQKIGILGSGEVGQSLGTAFTTLGHEVMLGAREANNEKTNAWAKKAGANAKTGTFAEAAKFGDIVFLCTLWTGTESALKMAGHDALANKIVVDVTNPLDFKPNQMPRLSIGTTNSGGEEVQRWLPKSKVVKCFNTVGNAHFFKPKFESVPTMFYCGNDAEAKKVVAGIVEKFGWEPLDAGAIDASRELEPLCILWVHHGLRSKGWNHAFKLLQK